MPDKRLSAAVGALQRVLTPVGRHMLIGGVAVIAHGVRRLTDDVDVTLWAPGVELKTLLRKLATEKIVPRSPDAIAFARRNQVLLLLHRPSGVDVDLSLAWLPFESAALDRASTVVVGRRRARVATPDDLIVYKAIAARQRDLSDVERLLELHGSVIQLGRVRRTIKELARALEHPELVDGFDRIVRAVRKRRPRPTLSKPGVRRKKRAKRS